MADPRDRLVVGVMGMPATPALTPAPSTTAPAPPTVPSSAVDLYTATSVERDALPAALPVTGSAWLVYALHVAGYLIGVGGAMLALCIPARRRLAKDNAR